MVGGTSARMERIVGRLMQLLLPIMVRCCNCLFFMLFFLWLSDYSFFFLLNTDSLYTETSS